MILIGKTANCAFTAIFSNICTAHAQKRLFMNFRCKFRHRRSICRPRFPIRVQNFCDFATFSIDFCNLYAECPPYFYFRFVWPTDLESIPHASTPTSIIPARFEVDMTIHCGVIVFLSADTSRDPVTLTIDLLTLNICHAWRVTWPTLPPSMKTPRLSVLALWVITFYVGYHWKCVRGYCACAESRDPWIWGQKQLHFLYAPSRFAYSLWHFGGSTMKVIKVICENNARPCVKRRMSFCACAKSRDLLRYPKCPIAVVFADVDLSYWTSKVEHIAEFTAILATFVLRMRRNGYLWTSGVNLDTAVWFADPDFLLECKISPIWRRFSLIFAISMLKVRHISTSVFCPNDLESIPYA